MYSSVAINMCCSNLRTSLLAGVHMEAGVKKAAVAQRLVRVALYDLLKVQLLTLVRHSRTAVQLYAIDPRAMRTELHDLSAALRAKPFR